MVLYFIHFCVDAEKFIQASGFNPGFHTANMVHSQNSPFPGGAHLDSREK